MAGSNKLSATFVARSKEPGRYGDGGGLYLQVKPGGTKSWLFRFQLRGKARQMGLGPADIIGLAEAREKARECRRKVLTGADPIDARRQERSAEQAAAERAMTFKECADAYIAAHRASWRNAKHAAQWEATFAETRRGKRVFPAATESINDLSVTAVDTALVLKVLERIWSGKPETASRVRGRIESVLDWATARGYRQGENPARWKGHLDHLLPRRGKLARVRHHAALPYPELPAFMTELRAKPGVSARALEFTILTVGRTGEVIAASWEEIDTAAAIWTVAAERMKSGREHRVPLCDRALAILNDLPREAGNSNGFVFIGARGSRPLSNMALLAVLKRMQRADLTVHGFRSSFRDWAAETTNFPNHVVEMALAHAIGGGVEAAYRRGDLFAKRKALMDEWGRYCEQAGNEKAGGA